MPLRSERPIVCVEPGSMHTIETRNAENLFGLWSVFSKCSPAMADGKRYENMAWRLWSRETFCCAPDHASLPRWTFEQRLASRDEQVPALSSSVDSDESSPDSAARSNSSSLPSLQRHDSANSHGRGKHMTPIDLEKAMSSISQKHQEITPLSPLPAELSKKTSPVQTESEPKPKPAEDPPPRKPSPSLPSLPVQFAPECSTSTVTTALGSGDLSPMEGSDMSTATDMSCSHSIVHGFDPGRISTSIRSSTNLTPNPILKSSTISRPEPTRAAPATANKKKATFTLGGSSDEDATSSFEASYRATRSSLSDNMHRSGLIRKTASFKNEVSARTYHEVTSEESEAIESDSEDEDDTAIEEEDSDEGDWEDDEDNSGPSSVNEHKEMFHKVDSKPSLVSRRSLLTTALHEPDREAALRNAASRSSPAIRRSRTSTPNGPSTGTSPQEDTGLMMRQQATRARPIIMTTSNVHPPALSPRTTRRNMLQTELTQSLRQNLLWERQQKNSTTNAVNKRAQSAVSIPALRRAQTTNDINGLQAFPQQAMNKSLTIREQTKNNSSYNDYFDQGLQEYHQKGW